MKEIAGKRVRLVYGILLAAFTVVVGALFLWQLISVCAAGSSPSHTGSFFSRAIIGRAFSVIAVPFFVWIGMIFVGFILWEIFPCPPKKKQPMPEDYALYRLKKRMPSSAGTDLQSDYEFVRKEENALFNLKFGVAVLCLAGVVYAVCYLVTPSNFYGGDKLRATEAMINLSVHLFPCVFAALALLCGVTVYERVSAKRQLPHVKKIVAEAKKNGGAQEGVKKPSAVRRIAGNRYVILGVRIALACFALTFILLGIFNGNMHAVMVKAINICLECIGIG